MILNKPMVDWLTLTTFNPNIGAAWLAYVMRSAPSTEEMRRLQYVGVSAGGLFAGEATQREQRHWMFQASGEEAHRVLTTTATHEDIRCTRTDLQVTVRPPKDLEMRQVYDGLMEWQTTGRKRQLSIVQSGDGNDTLYIGNRQSDRFTRLYIKPLVDDKKALRFECEFKGDHARDIYHATNADPEQIGEYLAGEIKLLPELKFGLSGRFMRVCGKDPRRSKPKREYAHTGSLRWLVTQVQPAMFRLMNDHEHGPYVRRIVRGWAAEAEMIDSEAELD